MRVELSARIRPLLSLWPLLLTFIVYIQTVNFGYVWDDAALLSANPAVERWENLLPALVSDFFEFTPKAAKVGYYRPVVTLTYFLDALVFGKSAAWSHFFNLGIHLMSGILLLLLARRVISNAPPVAQSVSLALFLLHPVNVEPVAWVSGRPELLSTAFLLWILLLERNAWEKRSTRLLQAALYFFALGAKEVAVIAPLLAWALSSQQEETSARAFLPGEVLKRAIPFGAAFLLYFVLRLEALSGATSGFLGVANVGVLLAVMSHYAGILILPLNLAINTRLPAIDEAVLPTIVGGVVFLCLTLGALAASFLPVFRTSRGGSWHVASLRLELMLLVLPLLPALLLMKHGVEMADRFLYWSTLGVALLAGRFVATPPDAARGLRWLPLIAVGGFTFLSWQRIPIWSNELALWEDAVRHDPGHAQARMSLAGALQRAGRKQEARQIYADLEQAKREKPEDAWLAGMAALSLGHAESAEEAFRDALSTRPTWVPALTGLGASLGNQGRLEEALQIYEKALAQSPGEPNAVLGAAEARRRLNLAREGRGAEPSPPPPQQENLPP